MANRCPHDAISLGTHDTVTASRYRGTVPTRTATDDDLAAGSDDAPAEWDERPIYGESRGVPWWSAIILAFGVTGLGAAIDSQLSDKPPTLITQAAYFLGCVAAVCWVRRRNLFGPMVQPPLVLAVVLFVAEIVSAGMPKSMGVKEILLDYGIPVINNFPAMAVTTGVTVLIGLVRLFRERDPERTPRGMKVVKRTKDDDEPRGRRSLPEDHDAVRPRRGLEPDEGLTAAAAAGRAPRPGAPPAGRTPVRGDRPAPGERAAGLAPGADRPAAGGRPGRAPAENRRGANRSRPLEPPMRDSGPRRRPQDSGPHVRPQDSGPHPRPRPLPQDSGPHLRPDRGTLAPRPQARRPSPQRPWDAEGGQPEPRRRTPSDRGGQIPRKPPPPSRRESPEPPPRSPGRRPPPPRNRRWDSDELG